MSKVIKKSVKLNDAVTIGNSSNNSTVLHRNTPENRTRVTLDFKGNMDSTIAKWQRKVEEHVSSVEQSMENKIEESFQKGYDKGFNEGVESEHADRENYIDKHFSDRFKVIESLLNEAKKKNKHASRGLEEKIINLAVSIAEKLINKSIKSNPKIIEEIVTDAMSHMISSETSIMKVSAEDYKVINSKYDKWLDIAGNVKEFRIEIDNRLNPGNCLIETEGGIIDALISSRHEILMEELLKVNK